LGLPAQLGVCKTGGEDETGIIKMSYCKPAWGLDRTAVDEVVQQHAAAAAAAAARAHAAGTGICSARERADAQERNRGSDHVAAAQLRRRRVVLQIMGSTTA
jgi:hypothetical protein